MERLFQTLDYIVVSVLIVFSAAYGLYASNIRHKQTTLIEYFLAEKNVSLFLVILSYFSSYASGPMSGNAIEAFLFGSQNLAYLFVMPAVILAIQHLVIPVFYPIQNVSMLKYFDLRFGKAVTMTALIVTITGMAFQGSVNIFVSAISIRQVSAISFWVAATIITAWCILYSTLGGMRGIIIADSIQAVIMIVSLLLILIIGAMKSGGRTGFWEINNQYNRLELFNFDFNPLVRNTFWSACFGFGFTTLIYNAMNQTLIQRCIMAPNIKSAQKMAKVGMIMSVVFIILYQILGLVTFAYYKGCNVQQTGKIKSINQLNSYFAMEILYEYPTLPGIYFAGLISASLSTISSILNSVAALIIAQFKEISNESKSGTIICKILVLISGLVMFAIIFILENFPHFFQAAVTFASLTCGPMFAVYCVAVFCPKSSPKCVAISFSVGIAFGFYILVGSILVKSRDLPKPFASCTSNATKTSIVSVNTTAINIAEENSLDAYFPLNKISYMFTSLEVFLATVICFIALSLTIGRNEQSAIQFDLNLIPPCVQKVQLKLSKKWQKVLLCDVYSDTTQSRLSTELQNMLSDVTESNSAAHVNFLP